MVDIQPAAAPGNFALDLEWSSVPGRAYTISTNTGLEASGWIEVASGITATSTTTNRVINVAGERTFVRVEVSFP